MRPRTAPIHSPVAASKIPPVLLPKSLLSLTTMFFGFGGVSGVLGDVDSGSAIQVEASTTTSVLSLWVLVCFVFLCYFKLVGLCKISEKAFILFDVILMSCVVLPFLNVLRPCHKARSGALTY